MSITNGFEVRVWKEPPFEDRYSAHDVSQLLAHARALEAMLKKHEWADSEFSTCPECGWGEPDGFKHAPDCQLAKLLSGVDK